jgi:hypothetical protein
VKKGVSGQAASYQLYSLALYPHLIHAAYGTELDPELRASGSAQEAT